MTQAHESDPHLQSHPAHRLRGNHLVVMFVALCATVVLAPVSAQAAGLQRVKVVGQVTATVSGAVRVKGPVTAQVPGTVRTVVGGTVSSVPTAPSRAFNVVTNGTNDLTTLVPGATRIAISSLVATNTTTAAENSYIDSSTANCAVPPFVVYASVPARDTVDLVFPTPIVIDARCYRLRTFNTTVTLTGYRIG